MQKNGYLTLDEVYKELEMCPQNTIVWESNPNLPTCKEKGITGYSNFFFDKQTKKLYTYRIKNYKDNK